MRLDGYVLALDLATTFGWAFGQPKTVPTCGHGRFATGGGIEGEVRFKALRWANDFFVLHKPAVVFIEEPILIQNRGNRRPENPKTLKRLWGLTAVVDAVAYGRGIYDVRTVRVDDVRRHFIGMKTAIDGEKAKRLTQERCTQLGLPWSTPDEADAIAIWAYGVEQVAPGHGLKFEPTLFPVPTRKLPQERITAKEAAEKYFKRGK